MVMGTTPGERLLCSKCFYDLGAMREDEGVCPECGVGYCKPAMRARLAAVLSLGLAMIGWGMGGAALIDLSLTRAKFTGGSDGDRTVHAPFCIVALVLVAAIGVMTLARPTARTRWEARWPLVVAVGVAIFELLNASYWRVFNGISIGAWLSQVRIPWYFELGNTVGPGLLLGAAALVVVRVAGIAHAAGNRWFGRAACVLVALGFVLVVAGWWCRSMLNAAAPRGKGILMPDQYYWNLQTTGEVLDLLMGAVWHAAMLAVAAAAIVPRSVWRAEAARRERAG